MLFDFVLDQETNQSNLSNQIVKGVARYKGWIAILISSIFVATFVSPIAALIVGVASCTVFYGYNLYTSISKLDFTVEIDDFSLEDVINDLECR